MAGKQVAAPITGEAIVPTPAPMPANQKYGIFVRPKNEKGLTSCCFTGSVLDLLDPQSVVTQKAICDLFVGQ